MVAKLLSLFLIAVVFAFMQIDKSFAKELGLVKKESQLNLIPGKSIGEASIGQDMKTLLALGFYLDAERNDFHVYQEAIFLTNAKLLVRLVENRVVGITVMPGKYSMLSLRGKVFPASDSPQTLRKFFRDCGAVEKGSAGYLIYCENRGVELVYSIKNKFNGLSVLVRVK